MPSFINWNHSIEGEEKIETPRYPYKSIGDADEIRRLEREFNIKIKKMEYLKEELIGRQDRLLNDRLVLMDLRQKYAILTNSDLGIIPPPRIIHFPDEKKSDKFKKKNPTSTKAYRQRIISTKVFRVKYAFNRRSYYNMHYLHNNKERFGLEKPYLEYLRGYKKHGNAGKDLSKIANEIKSVATTTAKLAFHTLKQMRNDIESLKDLEFGAGLEAHAREADSSEARLLEFRLNVDQLIQDLVRDVALLLLHNNLSNFVSRQVEGGGLEMSENASDLKNSIDETEMLLKNLSQNLVSYDKQLTIIRCNIKDIWNEMNIINKSISEYLNKEDRASANLDSTLFMAYQEIRTIVNQGVEIIKNDPRSLEAITSQLASISNPEYEFSNEEEDLFKKIEELMSKCADLKLRLSADKSDRKWLLNLMENNKEETWNLTLEIETQRRQNTVSQLLQRIKSLQETIEELTMGEKQRLGQIASIVEGGDTRVANLLAMFNTQCELELKNEEYRQIQDKILLSDPLKFK